MTHPHAASTDTCILKVVVGSHAHGLAGPDSDKDFRSVFVLPTAAFFRVGFKSNRWLLWAILSTFVLQILVLYVPFLSNILDTYPISLLDLGVSLALAFIVLLATEADRIFFNNRKVTA